MNTIPEISPDTTPHADPDILVLPAWFVKGWASTRSRIAPVDPDELVIAQELIEDARARGIDVTLADLGVRFNDELALAGDSDEASAPIFGTLKDKVVPNSQFPAARDAAALGSSGLAQQVRPPALAPPLTPPITGVTS